MSASLTDETKRHSSVSEADTGNKKIFHGAGRGGVDTSDFEVNVSAFMDKWSKLGLYYNIGPLASGRLGPK